MKLIVKVKGVDDFGRDYIGGNVYKYEHHYPRVNHGDFLFYYYPDGDILNIYEAKEELSYYYKDGFQHCSGKMCIYQKSAQEFVDQVKLQNLELGNKVESTLLDMLEKYS